MRSRGQLTSNNRKETNLPKFHPIGQYAFLGPGPTTPSVLPAGGNTVGARLQQLEFSHENLKYHTATSYDTALVNANSIDNPSFTKSSESRPFPTIIRPEPEVSENASSGLHVEHVNCKCQLGNAYGHKLSWKKRVKFKILYATVSIFFLIRLILLLFPFKIL
jgi:hypothetical protein